MENRLIREINGLTLKELDELEKSFKSEKLEKALDLIENDKENKDPYMY